MRRGLLKELAYTPTAIACGWRLYGNIRRLASLDGRTVLIDLLSGTCTVDGEAVDPPLGIAAEVTAWMRERFERDGIPAGAVTAAHLTVEPRLVRSWVRVACRTVIETSKGTYKTADTTNWGIDDE